MSLLSKGKNMPVPFIERAVQFKKGTRWLVGLFFLITVFAAQPALADQYVSDDWHIMVAPYVWGIAMDGDVTVDGREAEVDLSFSDILKDLNIALMLDIEARKNRFGFFINPLYSQTENDSTTNLLSGTPLEQKYKINTEIDLFIMSAGPFYRFGPWDLDSSNGKTDKLLIVDVMAGVRYTYLQINVDLDRKSGAPIPELPGHISEDGDKSWVDPIVGGRMTYVLSPQWMVSVLGDIGGFGVGSDFAWMVTAGVGYNFKAFGDRDSQFYAGYRAMNMDYSDGSGEDKFEWDVTLKGPVVSMGVAF